MNIEATLNGLHRLYIHMCNINYKQVSHEFESELMKHGKRWRKDGENRNEINSTILYEILKIKA